MIKEIYKPDTLKYGRFFLIYEADDEEPPAPKRNTKVINVKPNNRSRIDFTDGSEPEPEVEPSEETPVDTPDTTLDDTDIPEDPANTPTVQDTGTEAPPEPDIPDPNGGTEPDTGGDDVDFTNDEYKKDIEELREFCLNSECYALAPIQIGIPKRIIFIRNTSTDMTNNNKDYNEEIIYINPIIKNMYGHTRFLEGCGSCRYSNGNYVVGVVDRPYKIEVEYFDINGEKQNKIIEGFETTVFCHEYDHLEGILHMDRLDESSLMTLDQMKEFRTNNGYEVIDKDEIFSYDDIKIKK